MRILSKASNKKSCMKETGSMLYAIDFLLWLVGAVNRPTKIPNTEDCQQVTKILLSQQSCKPCPTTEEITRWICSWRTWWKLRTWFRRFQSQAIIVGGVPLPLGTRWKLPNEDVDPERFRTHRAPGHSMSRCAVTRRFLPWWLHFPSPPEVDGWANIPHCPVSMNKRHHLHLKHCSWHLLRHQNDLNDPFKDPPEKGFLRQRMLQTLGHQARVYLCGILRQREPFKTTNKLLAERLGFLW